MLSEYPVDLQAPAQLDIQILNFRESRNIYIHGGNLRSVMAQFEGRRFGSWLWLSLASSELNSRGGTNGTSHTWIVSE